MNKQEVLKKLEQEKETILRSQKNLLMESELWGFYEARATTFMSAINIVEQLDEPKKVKVPLFVAKWISKCRELNWILPDLLAPEAFESSFARNTEEWLRQDKQNYDILARAWLNGYEVEEEPKYRVNIGGLYLKEPLADTNDFTISMTWNKDYAYPFDSWNMAREHTSELGGTVEKV